MSDDWQIWQWLDSAFPAGAFAHSSGLEAAFQQNEIASVADLASFIRASLDQFASSAAPFVVGVCRDVSAFEEADRAQEAMLTNHVANRASRAQGRAVLATATQAFANELIQNLRAEVRRSNCPGHLAPITGAVAAFLGLDARQAVHLFLFTHLRGLVSASVRLGIVGPLQGQAIQHEISAFGQELADRSLDRTIRQAAQTSPILEVLQANHDRLYSRLFVS